MDLEAKALFGLARWVWALIILAALVIVALTVVHLVTSKPKAEANLGKNTTEAAQKNGADAVQTVGQVGKNDQASDDLTRTNADDIAHAKGADAPVDPAARDAGLRSLCKRRSYSRDPKCLQFAPAS